MEITGVLDIINEVLEGLNVVVFIFDTKILSKKTKADGYFLSTIRNKMNNKVQPLDIIKTTN